MYKPIEVECDGTGTKDDPIHIYAYQLPSDFQISSSKSYLKLENLVVSRVGLFDTENIQIEKSKISVLELHRCLNIQIIGVTNIRILELLGCKNNLVEKCEIKIFKSHNSINNQIKDCTFEKIRKYKRSRNNLITNCLIPVKEKVKLEKNQKERSPFYYD